MKKDAYWFQHDSNTTDNPKIMRLIVDLKMEGYGMYWVLLEHLRNQPDFKGEMSVLPALAMRNGTALNVCSTVVERYDLFVIKEEVFYSQSLIDRMQGWVKKKKDGRNAGIASGASRRNKSKVGSTKLNGGSTTVEQEEKRREEKKENKPKESTSRRGANSVRNSTDDNLTSEKQMKLSAAETFEIFWERYHEVTGKSKTDKAAALKKWKSTAMNLTNHRAAYVGIPVYFNWAMKEYDGRIESVKKARTYLEDRCWKDDYSSLRDREKDKTKTYV